jgi:hypothetical protein
MVLGWRLRDLCNEYVDLAGPSSGNAEVFLVGTSGRWPLSWRCVYCIGGCVVWMTGLLTCGVFRIDFPYKPSNV